MFIRGKNWFTYRPKVASGSERISVKSVVKTCSDVRRCVLCSAIFLACMIVSSSHATILHPIRSQQSGLPESILRESYAAIDRARATLLARTDTTQHLWSVEGSTHSTIFPALALCDPYPEAYSAVLQPALSNAINQTQSVISKSWTREHTQEATYSTLVQLLNFSRAADIRIVSRLNRTRLNTLDPATAALLVLALEGNEQPTTEKWQTLVNHLKLNPNSTITEVTLAALARYFASTQTIGPPEPDVQAHLKWIGNRIKLGYDTPFTVDNDPITPQAAYFIATLASSLPLQTFSAEHAPLPYDWRNHLANRLIAQQRKDPDTGYDYWDSSKTPSYDSATALTETTYAIMALVLLAE